MIKKEYTEGVIIAEEAYRILESINKINKDIPSITSIHARDAGPLVEKIKKELLGKKYISTSV